MGALVMVHSDDDGLVIPPKIAPLHVVMVPLINKDTQARLPEMQALANRIKAELGENYIVKYDDDDTKRSGFKFAEYELRGVPIRIAFGGRDLDNGTLEIARRDTREKMVVPVEGIGQYLRDLLDDIQQNLFNKAMAYRQANSCQANSWDEFKIAIGKGGFVMAHWDGTTQTEEAIKAETKATIRCIPLNNPLEDGVCVYSGKPSTQRVIFARAH